MAEELLDVVVVMLEEALVGVGVEGAMMFVLIEVEVGTVPIQPLAIVGPSQ